MVVLIRDSNPRGLSNHIQERLGNGASSGSLRDYGVGAQILLDLGVRQMVLMSNVERAIIGLDGFGLRIVDRIPIGAINE